jgi:hypothetical protein
MQRDDRIDQFLELRWGLKRPELAELLGVDPVTVWRWCTGRAAPHPAVLAVLRMMSAGELDILGGRDWRGWRLDRGGLWCPWFRRPFQPEHVMRLPSLEREAARPRHPQMELFP